MIKHKTKTIFLLVFLAAMASFHDLSAFSWPSFRLPSFFRPKALLATMWHRWGFITREEVTTMANQQIQKDNQVHEEDKQKVTQLAFQLEQNFLSEINKLKVEFIRKTKDAEKKAEKKFKEAEESVNNVEQTLQQTQESVHQQLEQQKQNFDERCQQIGKQGKERIDDIINGNKAAYESSKKIISDIQRLLNDSSSVANKKPLRGAAQALLLTLKD